METEFPSLTVTTCQWHNRLHYRI